MDFILPAANDYVEQFSDATPAYLRPMYEQTKLSHPHAHLQSNWNQGGFLSFFSKLIAPQYVLEIGTLQALVHYALRKAYLQKEFCIRLNLGKKTQTQQE